MVSNSFRESVEAVLADLRGLRDEWLAFEEELYSIFDQPDEVIGYLDQELLNSADHHSLCSKTASFLWRVRRLQTLCPIDHIVRFKLILGEIETLPLVTQGVRKADTRVSADLSAIEVRL